MAGDTLRAAVVPIKNHLIKKYQKRWRTTNPIVLNDLDEWKWSRACCRIERCDEALVVSVGMHDHDISMVEAVIHNRVLAIRIQLGSGSTLQRAEPLPVAMQEAATIVSWNREEIRIELQAPATI